MGPSCGLLTEANEFPFGAMQAKTELATHGAKAYFTRG